MIRGLIEREGGIEAVAVLLGKSYNCIRNWRANSPPLAKTADDIAAKAKLPVQQVRDAIAVSRGKPRR